MTNVMEVDVSSERDMVLTRVFDAPRALVWMCWTDPAHMAAWWGPDGMTNRVDQDIRPGGHQSIVMVAPDGAEYPFQADILDVIEEEKYVCKLRGEGHPEEEIVSSIVMTVTFEDAPDGGTILTVKQTWDTKELRDANMKMGAEPGWRESFEKLDTLLSKIVSHN